MSELDDSINDLSQIVIGAAIEVHRTLGAGFLESVYEKALAVEFNLRGISYERQTPLSLRYKGSSVAEARLDYLVDERLIVELKAVESFHPIHQAQVINYLKASRHKLGLLINFNVTKLTDGGIKRIVLS